MLTWVEFEFIRLKLTFHFCCQSGLEGPGGSLWACGERSRCSSQDVFRLTRPEHRTALCHWGPTNRDCVVMMWPQKDPRVEAVNSNYTPHPQSRGRFLLLKVVVLPLGTFSLNCWSLLHSKLIADSFFFFFSYRPLTDQLQSY